MCAAFAIINGVTDDHKPIQTVERVGPNATHIDGRPIPANLPVDYRERFAALTLRADFADDVFAHIANGGTLIQLAEVWGVRHSDISGFISTRDELRKRYDFALIVRSEWEVERCLQELRDIMTADVRDAYNPDGTLKNIKEIPANLAAALQSIESDEIFEGSGDARTWTGYAKKVKFWDKAKAIELFMKKHGLLVERKQVTHTMKLEDLIHPANSEIINVEESADPTGVSGVLRAPTQSP